MNNNNHFEVIEPVYLKYKENCETYKSYIARYKLWNTDDVEPTKAMWLVEEYFNLTTYDDDISQEWGDAIIEILGVINDDNNFDYIDSSEENYKKYLMVANLLEREQLIDWGTSIRGAWFDFGNIKKVKELMDELELTMADKYMDNIREA